MAQQELKRCVTLCFLLRSQQFPIQSDYETEQKQCRILRPIEDESAASQREENEHAEKNGKCLYTLAFSNQNDPHTTKKVVTSTNSA